MNIQVCGLRSWFLRIDRGMRNEKKVAFWPQRIGKVEPELGCCVVYEMLTYKKANVLSRNDDRMDNTAIFDVEIIIERLEIRKVPDMDNLTSEPFKNRGEDLRGKLQQLIQQKGFHL